MKKWNKYTAKEVLNGKDEHGNRLVISFNKDYRSIYNESICPSCKDFTIKYQKFIQKINNMKNNKSGFILKKMYENIPLKFGSGVYVNNGNITKETGKELLENHPKGKDLFSSIPEDSRDAISEKVQKLVDDNNKKSLVEKAKELGIGTEGNKIELATTLVAKLAEKEGEEVDELDELDELLNENTEEVEETE